VTDVAVDSLTQYLERGEMFEHNTLDQVMRRTFEEARIALLARAEELDVLASALNTTLLAVAATSSGIAGAAVGDGGIVASNNGEHTFLIPKENTEYANETTPIQSSDWEESYRFGVQYGADAVAVFTDGLDPFAWGINGSVSPRPELFDQLFNFFRNKRSNTGTSHELCAFLNQDNFRTYSSDDKTIAVGILSNESYYSQLFRIFDEA
jgi:hypothetical protein